MGLDTANIGWKIIAERAVCNLFFSQQQSPFKIQVYMFYINPLAQKRRFSNYKLNLILNVQDMLHSLF